MGPTIKPATLDNSAIASPVTPSSSRRRFLIGSDGIAAAASLRTVTMAATTQRANATNSSNHIRRGDQGQGLTLSEPFKECLLWLA
jgi:hypothetical protein